MYEKLYELLVDRMGNEAARAGIRSQYASIGLILTGIVDIAISNSGDRSWTVVWCLVASVILAGAVLVYSKMLFARAISKYLDIKVYWYGTPNLRPIGAVDVWIKAVKVRALRTSQHNQR